MYCFYVDTGNCDDDYSSYEVIGNNFYIGCCNLNFDFVFFFLIYCVDCHLIFDSLICCMSYSVIYCLDNYYYDCWNSLYFYCLSSFYSSYSNSFYFSYKMNFVIDCLINVYFCLSGSWMLKQIVLSLNLIVGSYFDYLIDYIYFVRNFVNFFVRVIYLYN